MEKRLREEFGKLQVEINDEKSRIVDLERGESFGFLTSATSAVDAERGGRTTRPSSKSGRRWCGSSKRCSAERPAWLRPKQTDLVPGKGQFRSPFPHPLSYGCPRTIFLDHRNRHRHHLSATLLDARAGNGWARLLRCGRDRSGGGGFRMLVMSRIHHAAIVP